MRITKIFKFDAAHRLANYNGNCKRIHGHTYQVHLTLEGPINKLGMVYDFGELKQLFEEYIESDYDHKFLLNKQDSLNQQIAKIIPKDWVLWFPDEPTAEVIASDIKTRLRDRLPTGIQLVKVKVWESPTAYAEI